MAAQAPPRDRGYRRRGWVAGALIMLINALFAGITGLFVTTQSVAITMASAGAAVGLAGLIVLLHREPRAPRRPTPQRGRKLR